mmetsp:Transcript_10512/g.14320  ORF Transcript_10512/g.14320 Transcript_10512/m.14320 type:complete len:214 (+) Transcript_10512:78-719(+)
MKRKLEEDEEVEDEIYEEDDEEEEQQTKQAEPSKVPARQIFLSGFRSATEAQIREFFESCGGITSMSNKQGKVKGVYKREVVLCTFKKDKAVKKAIALNGTPFLERSIKIGSNTEPIHPPKQAEGSERVCVRNLPLNISTIQVEKMFSKCGTVVFVRFVYNEEKQFRGFCYITFKGTTGMPIKKALDLDGAEVGGREISVTKAAGKNRTFPSI